MVKDLPANAGGLGAQVGLLEEEMAKHSDSLAWIITWAEEPGGLQSIELQRVRHDRVQCTNTSACLKLKEKLKETGNIFHNIIYFGWPSCWQRADLQNRLHFKRSYNFLGKKKEFFSPVHWFSICCVKR